MRARLRIACVFSAVLVFGLVVFVAPSASMAASNEALNTLTPLANGPTTSLNWAGISASGKEQQFDEIQGSWAQPNINCTSNRNTSGVIWVGIGTGKGDQLFQIGTNMDCTNGKKSFSAWWEEYPLVNTQQVIAGDKVVPGDAIYGTVTYDGSTVDLRLSDIARSGKTRWKSSKTLADSEPALSAECIVERPKNNDGTYSELTDFGAAMFSDCVGSTETGGPAYLTPGTKIKHASVNTIAMVNGSTVLATIGHYTQAGGFISVWKAVG